MKKLLMVTVLIGLLVVATVALSPKALAADIANGARIFEIDCAGCHPNGGNIIRRGKTLKKPALKRHKMDSLEAIASLVTNGKRPMSAYKDRLTETEILDVSTYILERAKNGWK